ncbi:DUF2807 domain-containing protein [Halosquirtibacter laminarini]|uniref:DUF2807 domain-containing protein n=1 Tax=Halosquirtibacter laminarini TaxID=3374600 RepID=A0AC61NPH2_9BACT|nr:DUF2807 domain-containing protein [Prolixibacteraceae bacterium]
MKRLKHLTILLYIIGAVCTPTFAQEKQVIASFDRLIVDNNIKVEIHHAEDPYVEIFGSPNFLDKLKVQSDNGTLRCYFDKSFRVTEEEVASKNHIVLYTPIFRKMLVRNTATVVFKEKFDFGDHFDMAQENASKVRGEFSAKEIKMVAINASSNKLIIRSELLDVAASNASNVDLNATSNKFNIIAKNASSCKLNVSAKSGRIATMNVSKIKGVVSIGSLKCVTNSNSRLTLDIESKRVDANITGLSDVEFSGKTSSLFLNTDKTDIDARKLKSEVCYVKVFGKASVSVYATQKINALVNSKGNLKCYGTAKVQCSKNTKGHVERFSNETSILPNQHKVDDKFVSFFKGKYKVQDGYDRTDLLEQFFLGKRKVRMPKKSYANMEQFFKGEKNVQYSLNTSDLVKPVDEENDKRRYRNDPKDAAEQFFKGRYKGERRNNPDDATEQFFKRNYKGKKRNTPEGDAEQFFKGNYKRDSKKAIS